MMRYAVIDAPSVLGLFPRGVEQLPEALRAAGLVGALRARDAGRVSPPPYDSRRDPDSGLLNPHALRAHALRLAGAVADVRGRGETPMVLGGDCSILLGCLAAVQASGRHGLLYVDGHADFYHPEVEPNGEAASMALALATGRGPAVVTALTARGPLVGDRDVVQFGQRDAEEAADAGCQRPQDVGIAVTDLATIHQMGVDAAVGEALERLTSQDLDGFWLHLDCDVLDDAIMPAVDYRLPGGLAWDELVTLLDRAVQSGSLIGVDITIFNPTRDHDGSIARDLVTHLARGLAGHPPAI